MKIFKVSMQMTLVVLSLMIVSPSRKKHESATTDQLLPTQTKFQALQDMQCFLKFNKKKYKEKLHI
jgi:hypothetical protein